LNITVCLHDVLKERAAAAGNKEHSKLDLVMPAGATAADLLDQLSLPQSRIGMIVTDGSRVGFDYRLKDRDVIQLFAPLAGG